MGMSAGEAATGGRRRKGSRARRAPMSEINVTPMVDVMLVLLIIFMVAAPLLATGVPLNLPKAAGKPLPTSKEKPVTISIDKAGAVFIADSKIELDQLTDKLAAVAAARGKGTDETILVRSDATVDYGSFMKVMAKLSAAGYAKVSLIADGEGQAKQK